MLAVLGVRREKTADQPHWQDWHWQLEPQEQLEPQLWLLHSPQQQEVCLAWIIEGRTSFPDYDWN